MSELSENYRKILERIRNVAIRSARDPSEIKLVAVSKTHPAASIREATNAGCTMFGENKVPPISVAEVPGEAKSLALIMDDPDAPRGTFNHWLVFNMDTKTSAIGDQNLPAGAVYGRNDFGQIVYCGPRPPAGEHRYFINVHALDSRLSLPEGVERPDLESAMEGHVLATASLMGRYEH